MVLSLVLSLVSTNETQAKVELEKKLERKEKEATQMKEQDILHLQLYWFSLQLLTWMGSKIGLGCAGYDRPLKLYLWSMNINIYQTKLPNKVLICFTQI